MEVVICRDGAEAGSRAADAIEELFTPRPEGVLGVATGSSPLAVYAELGRRVRSGRLTLRGASAFMLDEYVGLRADHPERCRNVIDREFVAKVDIDPSRVHGPDGSARDVPAACAAYEQAIVVAGGVDLQILGIGTDGHIAFNEPGSSLASRTRIKTLTGQTRTDNARFFDATSSRSPPIASPRASAPSWPPDTSCCWRRAAPRPTRSTSSSRDRCRRCGRPPPCSGTRT